MRGRPQWRHNFRGVRGHTPPKIFWNLGLWNGISCILSKIYRFEIPFLTVYLVKNAFGLSEGGPWPHGPPPKYATGTKKVFSDTPDCPIFSPLWSYHKELDRRSLNHLSFLHHPDTSVAVWLFHTACYLLSKICHKYYKTKTLRHSSAQTYITDR